MQESLPDPGLSFPPLMGWVRAVGWAAGVCLAKTPAGALEIWSAPTASRCSKARWSKEKGNWAAERLRLPVRVGLCVCSRDFNGHSERSDLAKSNGISNKILASEAPACVPHLFHVDQQRSPPLCLLQCAGPPAFPSEPNRIARAQPPIQIEQEEDEGVPSAPASAEEQQQQQQNQQQQWRRGGSHAMTWRRTARG